MKIRDLFKQMFGSKTQPPHSNGNTTATFFPGTRFPSIDTTAVTYPSITSLPSNGVHAYRITALIQNDQLPLVEQALRRNGYELDGHDPKTPRFNAEENAMTLNVVDDFEGQIIDLITNDATVINDIIDLPLSPPSPEQTFPDDDVYDYGSLQGHIEYWCYALWKPYWDSLSRAQRQALPMREEWFDFMTRNYGD